MADWIILADQNIAIRFQRHEHHIDFLVFEAAFATYFENGKKGEQRWEIGDCGDDHPLDQWADAHWELRGHIKWDGCINWETNPDCMAHGCGTGNLSRIHDTFAAIYAFAKRHFDLLGDEAPTMPSPFLEIAQEGQARREGE